MASNTLLNTCNSKNNDKHMFGVKYFMKHLSEMYMCDHIGYVNH